MVRNFEKFVVGLNRIVAKNKRGFKVEPLLTLLGIAYAGIGGLSRYVPHEKRHEQLTKLNALFDLRKEPLRSLPREQRILCHKLHRYLFSQVLPQSQNNP